MRQRIPNENVASGNVLARFEHWLIQNRSALCGLVALHEMSKELSQPEKSKERAKSPIQ